MYIYHACLWLYMLPKKSLLTNNAHARTHTHTYAYVHTETPIHIYTYVYIMHKVVPKMNDKDT